MKNLFIILILIFAASCQEQSSPLRDNISFHLSIYQDSSGAKASAMPVLNANSELMPYERRFDYLLMNVPAIFQADKFRERDDINKLYPDTAEIKRRYMDAFCQDKQLSGYFDDACSAIKNPGLTKDKTYTVDELMEVASKFFYCDEVYPDTTIQSHVCIGINGVREAKWQKDYTLLAAFCFEAIFNDMDKDSSQVRSSYYSEKEGSCEQFRNTITSLDKYLIAVRLDLFSRMKANAVLKEKLLSYYDLNKNNLAFIIAN